MATKKSPPKKSAAKKTAPKKTSKKKPAPKAPRKSSVVGTPGYTIVGKQTMLNPGDCPTCTMEVNIALSAFTQESPDWPTAKVTWDPVNKVLKVTDQG